MPPPDFPDDATIDIAPTPVDRPPSAESTRNSSRLGVLDSITHLLGETPHVFLRDTDASPATPTSSAFPEIGLDAGRYQLYGEIARGGMGAVLKGRDPDLGRDLAIKVVLEKHKNNAEVLRRFVEEAQIGGQLQHPGIVPIYDMGRFADERPFFAMKLVRGRTLAALLAERPSPAEDLPRFLTIFEAICQTVGYAHARAVIHRDLKPPNVMVGSFGEVQVMDWGLAKVLDLPPAPEDCSRFRTPAMSEVRTARSGSDVDGSQAGSVLGTPAYMSPEQANGQVDSVDERTDVFGLGSILCEILCGDPAYVGRNGDEVFRKAMRGDTADAFRKLDACGADGELIALAREAMNPEPLDRPRDAKVMAGRVAAHLAGVQDRLRRAEIAEVEARGQAVREREARILTEAKVAQEKKARRLTVALAATVLISAAIGGGSWWWVDRQARDRGTLAAVATADARLLLDRARRAPPWDPAPWREAREAARRGSDLLAGANPSARRAIDEISDEIGRGEDDAALLQELGESRSAKEDDPNGSDTEAEYALAFGKRGIDFGHLTPREAADAIRTRPPAVVVELAAILDDWAKVRRDRRGEELDWRKLVEVARLADPDPYRDRLRASLPEGDAEARIAALRRLALDPAAMDQPAPSLVLLALSLDEARDMPSSIALLRKAQQRHPLDVWVNYFLGKALCQTGSTDEGITFLSIARGLHPETGHDLAHALEVRGRDAEAIAAFRELARLRPGNGLHHICLGNILNHDPKWKAEAEASYGTAIKLAREAIDRRPEDAIAHKALGTALGYSGRLDEGVAELFEAVRLDPYLIAAYANLSAALRRARRFNEAIEIAQAAARIRPDVFGTRANLGFAYMDAGRIEEAIEELREAVRLGPDYAQAQFYLGNLLMSSRDIPGSLPHLREAARLWPHEAEFRLRYGVALVESGQNAEALGEIKAAHEIGSKRPGWGYKTPEMIAACEKLVALEARIPAIQQGKDAPKDLAERLTLAKMCYDKAFFAMATRLYAEAMAEEPKLVADPQSGLPYNAACSAAMASTGKGKDDPSPDLAAREKLRRQAIDWLAADLPAWQERIDAARGDWPIFVPILAHWREDADLLSLRDPAEVAKLPEADREACRKLWADLDALLARIGKPK